MEILTRAGGRAGGRKEGRKGGREEGREGGREEGREGGREGGRDRGREGGRETLYVIQHQICYISGKGYQKGISLYIILRNCEQPQDCISQSRNP